MSGRTPRDEHNVQTTVDDLPAVDTAPNLKPVSATLTLDEEPDVNPSTTQLLDPVNDLPTDPKVRIVPAAAQQLIGDSVASTQPRKRTSVRADAFESAPSLQTARNEEVVPRGPPPPWERAPVWTPGLVVLAVALAAMVLVGVVLIVR